MLTADRGRSETGSDALAKHARSKRIKKKPTVLAETVADGLLIFEVVGSVLAIGAVHRPVLLAFALPLLIGGFVSAIWLRPASIRICAPAVVAAALGVYTLIQALPLPIGLLRVIAHANADIWDRALLPFGEHGPAWASLSLDPGASCIEAVKWLVYAAVFTLAASASSRRGAAWGVTIVFASGVLVALVTLGHGLAGATTLYGFYEPRFDVAQWHVSPLLNSNSLAGYLNLAAMCGLGLLSAREPNLPRWVVGLGVAVMIGVAVVSASRGGVAALPIGFLLLAAILWTRPRRSPMHGKGSPIRSSSGLFLLAASGGMIFAALGITPSAWQELYDKNVQKLETIAWVKPMVAAHPWFGIGRGAFESVFAAFKPSVGNTVHAYAENLPAQWISEWGLPVGIAALGAFAWLFRPSNAGVRRSVICAAAWTGMAVLLLQNLVDLGLELPSVSIAAACVLGTIWGDGRRRGTPAGATGYEFREVVRERWFAPTVAAALVIVLGATVGAMRAAPYAVADENRQMHAALTSIKPGDSGAYAALRRRLREPILRHPAEAYFSLIGAMACRLGKDESAMPWLSRALERANVNGAAHLTVADVLIERRALLQAILEVRLAVHDDPALGGPAVDRLLTWTKDYDMLMRAVPPDGAGAPLLDHIGGRLASLGTDADLQLGERIDREALVRDPNLPGPHVRLANQLIRQVRRRGAEACPDKAMDRCDRAVREHAAIVERAQPRLSTADRLVAEWLVATGRSVEADRLLEGRCDAVQDRAACLQMRLTIVAAPPPAGGAGTAGGAAAGPAGGGAAGPAGGAAAGPAGGAAAGGVAGGAALVGFTGGAAQVAKVASVARELANTSCATDRAACASTCSWIGDVLSSRGDWGGTVGYYARAAAEEPTEMRYVKVANAAARIGAHGQAADALEKALGLHGGQDAELSNRIREERLHAIGAITTTGRP